MKLKFGHLTLATLFLLNITVVAKAATNFDVGHDAIHRMERLIDLGKIADTYSANFKSMTLEKLNPDTETDHASFKATIQQVANSNGSAKKVEIRLDANGKSISDKELTGNDATNPPQWPDKGASELVEEGMHHVLHINDPKYAPFVNNLSGVSLSQEKAQDGTLRAVVTLTATGTKDTLVVTMKTTSELDGNPVVKTP